MTKYHIDINGVPAICRAEIIACPRGGGQEHYSTKEEAQVYADFLNETEARLGLRDFIINNKEITSEDAKKRAQEVENIIRNPLIERFNTKRFYYNPVVEEWDEERAKLHNEIINEFLNEYENVPSDKKVIISAGLPGAGKTTVLGKIPEINISEYAIVNSDDIKEKMVEKGMIPEIRGLTPLESAGLIHEESSYLADKLQIELSKRGKNTIYDMTSKSRSSVKRRLAVFQNRGYNIKDVTMVFVDIDIETSKERANDRYRDGLNDYIQGKSIMGGRYIPKSVFETCRPTWKDTSSINQEVFKTIKMDKSFPIKTIEYRNNIYGEEPKRIY